MLNIVKASAGSGKTYKLAYEYIKLILGYTDENNAPRLHTQPKEEHQYILAITFTNKATEEMKQRIVKELYVLSFLPNESAYISDLKNYYNTSEVEISKVAGRALKELLHNFSAFNISTIDSFFQTILRTFAREAEINYDYDIEMNNDYAIKMAINNMISSLNSKENNDLMKWLKKYIKSQMEKGENWSIYKSGDTKKTKSFGSDSISEISNFLKTETYVTNYKKINDYFKDENQFENFLNELEGNTKKTYNDILSLSQTICETLNSAGFSVDNLAKNTAIYTHLNRFLTSTKKNDIRYAFTDAFSTEAIEGDKWYKKNLKNDAVIESIRGYLLDIYNCKSLINTFNLILKNIYALGLLKYIDQSVQDIRDSDVILLSDTNKLLSRIINDDDIPFIYERVGMYLRNFLIDEFQDTSRMQWDNIKPLLKESLSYGNENLIIGDVKQSIYRFRNADSSLLQKKVYDDFPTFIDGNKADNISINWRSRENIIKFNNAIFSSMPAILDGLNPIPNCNVLSNIYKTVIQQISPKNIGSGGHIVIQEIEKKKRDKSNDAENIPQDEEAIEAQEESTALTEMIKHIHRFLDNEYRLKDIAILVNTNREGEMVISEILNASTDNGRNLNVISDESLLLKNSTSVRNIISILKFIDEHRNELPSAEEGKETDENRTECPKYSKNEIIPILLHRYTTFLNDDNNKTHSEALQAALSKEITEFEKSPEKVIAENSISLFNITEAIIKEFIPTVLLKDENNFIQAFQDAILNYSSRSGATLHGFLTWWDANCNTQSVTSPPDIDAIKVMTIHKSKGLEFPCVIIPFCKWDMNNTKGLFWSDENIHTLFKSTPPPYIPLSKSKTILDSEFQKSYIKECYDCFADSLNKTYVAFTRAVDELVIITESFGKEDLSLAKCPVSKLLMESVRRADKAYVDTSNIKCQSATETTHPFMDVLKDLWNEETHTLEFGTPTIKNDTKKEKKEKKDDGGIIFEPFKMPDYSFRMNKVDMKFNLPDIIEDSPRQEGILYHKILSMIENINDAELALLRCKAKGMIEDSKYDEVHKFILDILSQDEAKDWFSPENKVLNERSIAINKRGYRPDRIIITPENKTIIIDYKFGEKEDDSYKNQVRNYMNILEQAGLENLIGKIWYPKEKLIVTV